MKDEICSGRLPDSTRLGARFDAAMVKKTAVLSLPPAFWSRDPKINPRAADLVLAALVLGSAERLGLAEGALLAEEGDGPADGRIEELRQGLLALAPPGELRAELARRADLALGRGGRA